MGESINLETGKPLCRLESECCRYEVERTREFDKAIAKWSEDDQFTLEESRTEMELPGGNSSTVALTLCILPGTIDYCNAQVPPVMGPQHMHLLF